MKNYSNQLRLILSVICVALGPRETSEGTCKKIEVG